MSEAVKSTFVSVSGETLEKRLWLPEGEPRGIVQLVHGMSEHIARYDATAKALNAAGYAVVGHTHLGHGEHAKQLGWFAQERGWDSLIEDVHALRTQTQALYPDVPYFLLGHSMGSFVVRTYCLKHEAGLRGVLISGTGHFEPGIISFGRFLSSVQCAFGGEKKPCHLLEKVSFAGYNREWKARTAFDWLSKENDVVDAYVADPYCGFTFTAGGYRDLFDGLARLVPANLSAMDPSIPVLLFSGESDPVGGRGAGVRTTAQELEQAGITDVTLKLYPGGRHEMFNETEREQVWADVIRWLDDHIA